MLLVNGKWDEIIDINGINIAGDIVHIGRTWFLLIPIPFSSAASLFFLSFSISFLIPSSYNMKNLPYFKYRKYKRSAAEKNGSISS